MINLYNGTTNIIMNRWGDSTTVFEILVKSLNLSFSYVRSLVRFIHIHKNTLFWGKNE